MTTPNRVRGTQDIAFEDQRRFAHVLSTFERVRALYCFQRIDTPVIEDTQVFARSIGETTDVVSKEMYTFEDRGGDRITLRPEFTAGIARAFVTNGWAQHAPMKIATSGALFRYERPQKGRFRQFHQIDAEIIGAAEPAADVELLVMADQLLSELGIEEVTLQLNTLGDAETRDAWRAALVTFFNDRRSELSEESVKRLSTNPLRILDSKDARDIGIVSDAPVVAEVWNAATEDRFFQVTAGLEAAGVDYNWNQRLVRGLDYYRHTAFEFVTDRLGAQGTVLGGGRYDGLIESLGGEPTAGVGWAAGVERLAMLVEEIGEARPNVIFVAEDEHCESWASVLITKLRRRGVSCDAIVTGSERKRFDKARKRADYVVTLRFRNGAPTSSEFGNPTDEVRAKITAFLGSEDSAFA